MVAFIFFILAFSFVCEMLNVAIRLTRASSPISSGISVKIGFFYNFIFELKFFPIINGLFSCYVAVSCYFCLSSNSLGDFFNHSIPYFILTNLEILINVIYATCLLRYGFRLVNRIRKSYLLAESSLIDRFRFIPQTLPSFFLPVIESLLFCVYCMWVGRR
jgi:hypothetical protein